MESQETMEAWVVWANRDQTEGRGPCVPLHVCKLESTAIRLAKGVSVQGANGDVARIQLYHDGEHWFGPVYVEEPRGRDQALENERLKEREAKELREAAFARAESLGMTPREIQLMRQRGGA